VYYTSLCLLDCEVFWNRRKEFYMKKKNILLCCVLAIVLTILAVFLSIWIGARVIPFHEILQILQQKSDDELLISVVNARIPRTIFGLLAGGALGVSGAIMQSVTRNPVADPSILGVNTGAALFVVIGIVVFHISLPQQYIWLALAGAAITTIFVYGIASLGKSGITPIKLALSGATVSTAFGSIMNTILLPDADAMNKYRFWSIGSVGAASWDSLKLLLPFFVIGIVLVIVLSPYLNIVALGDEMASSLGVNVKVIRFLSCVSAILLCGATTALAGPIGFVGLMIPHMLRLLIGSNMKVILPLSILCGGSLLLLSDVIGRIVGRPGETEVGIITAIIGAPVFIFIIMKVKVKSL
jgi:iron complex transport system permease protein